MGCDYLTTPKQWDRLVEIVRRAGVCGTDTEYYGLDSNNQSCVGRARIHVWSIAVRTPRMGPMGFRLCCGWCLSGAALDYPPIKALLEDPSIRKEVHNQSVDHHAFANHGIRLKGARNTLGLVRWTHPHLVNSPGRFKLKALMSSLLGREPISTFAAVVSDERTIQVPKLRRRKLKGCSCGVVGCRARKPAGGVVHDKWTRVEVETVHRDKREKFKYPLEDIVPGHKRWDLLVRYSIEDSVAALQLAEVCDEARNPAPWPYAVQGTPASSSRPGFNQAVELAVIRMEATGFRRDKEFCERQIAVALADEARTLDWLHRWFVVNSGEYGPHGRRERVKVTPSGKEKVVSGTDAVWTSGAKKLRLFDSLGFPRSPIWAKGRVKEGKAKLDWAAMAWIARNHPPAKTLAEKLLLLGRIRSGLKYLQQLRDAEDIVHPICGPAGDDDDRAGAVTGRLAVKGECPAQQLPKAGEKDLYNLRRSIVA